jgi:hypothetical protein
LLKSDLSQHLFDASKSQAKVMIAEVRPESTSVTHDDDGGGDGGKTINKNIRHAHAGL